MTDLLGREMPEVHRQRDLLAGRCGLGVEAVWRVIEGVEYVRTPSGYVTRADGTGPLLLESDLVGEPLERGRP